MADPAAQRTKHGRRALAAAALLVALVAFTIAGSSAKEHRAPADAERYSVWGVDVSHHQGEIDWKLLRGEERIAFAYLKATEGGDWTDPAFLRNWGEARAAGFKVGAYHFLTFCRPIADQAAHFLATVPPGPGALPPAIDVEFEGNCQHPPPREEIQRNVLAMLELVAKDTGRTPVLYVTQEAWDVLLSDVEVPYPVWLRSLSREPPPGARPPWLFWQFDAEGKLAGVKTPVDLNVFRGSAEELARL